MKGRKRKKNGSWALSLKPCVRVCERCEVVEVYGMMECSLMCLYETLFIFQVGFSRVSDVCE